MPVRHLPLADPEIAAVTFKVHLDRLWGNGRPERFGWVRKDLDALHTLITLPAKRRSGEVDTYHFLLGAEHYDAAPPTVALVEPDGHTHPSAASKWFPVIDPRPPWFGLHAEYHWPDGHQRQLVCFSFAAGYYMTDHSPKESEEWKQGRHTVAATLYRLAEVLSPNHYRGPGA